MSDHTTRAEIIDFAPHLDQHNEATAEAAETVKSAREWIEQADRVIGTAAISLAITFEWGNEFEDDVPIGTVVTIDEHRLDSAKDPKVAALRDLQRHVREVLELLSDGSRT